MRRAPAWPASSVLSNLDGLPEGLLSQAGRRWLDRVCEMLGAEASSYYLECRLDDDPQVDFLALLRDRRGCAEGLLRAGVPAGCPIWRRALSLLRGWAGSGGCADIPFVWLEFDGTARMEAAPLPNPAFGLERQYFHRHIREPEHSRTEEALALVHEALPHLLEREQLPETLRAISRLSAALPPGGSLICVTAMIARDPPVTKLYLSLPRNAMTEYLRAIAWPGSPTRVESLSYEFFPSGIQTMFLDIALAPELRPSLGLAASQFHLREQPSVDVRSRWGLLAGGPPRVRSAIRRWSGFQRTDLAGPVPTEIRRWVDFKAVLGVDGRVRCKSYLGFMPSLVPPLL